MAKLKPYTKQFTILFIILIAITAGFAYYNYTQQVKFEAEIANLEATINQQAQLLDQKIALTETQLQQRLVETKSELKGEITTVSQDVSSVQQQTEQQFQGISGQIQGLEQQSQKLEESLLNINVQSKDFSAIIDQIIPAVVSIRTDTGLGSGAIIHEDGYAITNYHVIDNINAAAATTYDGRRYSIRIVGTSASKDLAIIKLNGDNFKRLKWGSSEGVRLGEKVIALGNPGGLDFTVTEGIISSTNRQASGVSYLQHDVAINPGNSGGPLVNVQGRIIGVNTLKKSDFEGIGFAIESDLAEDFADPIVARDIELRKDLAEQG